MFQGLVNITEREKHVVRTEHNISSDDLVGGCLLFWSCSSGRNMRACICFSYRSLFHTLPFAQTRGEGSNLNTANTTRERTAVDKPHEVLMMLDLRTQHLFTSICAQRPGPTLHRHGATSCPTFLPWLPNSIVCCARTTTEDAYEIKKDPRARSLTGLVVFFRAEHQPALSQTRGGLIQVCVSTAAVCLCMNICRLIVLNWL